MSRERGKKQYVPYPWSPLESLPMFSGFLYHLLSNKKYCYSNSPRVVIKGYRHMFTFYIESEVWICIWKKEEKKGYIINRFGVFWHGKENTSMVSTRPADNGCRTVWNRPFALNMLRNKAGSHSLSHGLYLSNPTGCK